MTFQIKPQQIPTASGAFFSVEGELIHEYRRGTHKLKLYTELRASRLPPYPLWANRENNQHLRYVQQINPSEWRHRITQRGYTEHAHEQKGYLLVSAAAFEDRDDVGGRREAAMDTHVDIVTQGQFEKRSRVLEGGRVPTFVTETGDSQMKINSEAFGGYS